MVTQRPQNRKFEQLRQLCISHIRSPHIKRAEIDGSGDASNFEVAFSNLAHAYLRDRAPQLLEYELGFQMLEKNKDNDRAVGIIGFKVGNQLLYAPVFFLNGELKGHELLYIKNSDTFVPMKENWINYILQRKPSVIGDEVGPQLGSLGIQRPNLDAFRDSPMSGLKSGSSMPQWVQEGLPGLMYVLGNPVSLEPRVPGLVKTSASCALRFVQLLDAYPKLVKPIVECYGPSIIDHAIAIAKTASTAYPVEVIRPSRSKNTLTGSLMDKFAKTTEVKWPDLCIWVYDGTPGCAEGLSPKQAETLKRDGVYIEDTRSDASKAYSIQEPVSMQNPDNTGVYDVLCRPAELKKCLYIHAPVTSTGSQYAGVVVSLDGDSRQWAATAPANTFVMWRYPNNEYEKLYESLSSSEELRKGGQYVLVTPNGAGTAVFEVEKVLSNDKETRYQVSWTGRYCLPQRPFDFPPVAQRHKSGDEPDTCCPAPGYNYADAIVFGRNKGPKFIVRHGEILAPANCKVIKLKEPDCNCGKDNCDCNAECKDCRSEQPPLLLGNHVDLQLGLYKSANELKVFNNGIEAVVGGLRMSPKAALIKLVRDYGLREKAARALLKEAELKRGIKCWIKAAQPGNSPYEALGYPPEMGYMPEPEYGSDNVMGSGQPALYNTEQEVPIEGLQGGPSPSMSAPVEPQMAQQIGQAAQTGQQEVLDTAILSNLLRGSQNETLIDKHLPHLMRALDSIGRLIFNMYWHRDKFEDRYGSKDLTELEDGLRNSFETLGDVTIELKDQMIEPFPDGGVDVEFGGNR